MLKGHVGIGKFLLDIPGVDINVKDDKGRTVLANMIASLCADKPLTRELMGEIRDMVERRGANATVADNDGRNALHLLCRYDALPPEPSSEDDTSQGGFTYHKVAPRRLKCVGRRDNGGPAPAPGPGWPWAHQLQEPKKEEKRARDDYTKKWKEQKELMKDLLKFLLDKGVSTLATDKEGYVPVAYAFEATYDVDRQATTYRKYYDNIAIILNRMEEEAENEAEKVWKPSLSSDTTKPNVLHVFCRNVSLVAIELEKSVYASLQRIMKKLSPDPGDLDTVIGGSSPFFSLCKRYSEIADLEESHYRGSVAKDVVFADLEWDRDNRGLQGMERLTERFRRLIFDFERDFTPRLSYDYFTDEEKKKKATVSVLSPLAECAYKKEGHRAFKAMLKYTSEVEVQYTNCQLKHLFVPLDSLVIAQRGRYFILIHCSPRSSWTRKGIHRSSSP